MMKLSQVNEVVPFRLLQMPCCGHLLCWVNPRIPSYCPECGTHLPFEFRKTLPDPTRMWLRTEPEVAE